MRILKESLIVSTRNRRQGYVIVLKIMKRHYLIHIICFFIGVIAFWGGKKILRFCKASPELFLPVNTEVCLDSTNLPIIFISTSHKVDRDSYTQAYMKIISNSKGSLNYCDTLTHPNQTIDYEGLIQLKYRGHASYLVYNKKSYAIRPMNPHGGG